MPRFKMVNGERIQFTAEEETARDAEEKAWADGAVIEWSNSPGDEWRECATRNHPNWTAWCYRVKPDKTEAEIERDAIVAEMDALKHRLDALPVTS